MMMTPRCLLLLLLTTAAAFAPCHRITTPMTRLYNAEDGEEEPSLLLGEDMESELNKFKSKYPTSESDFLAAARQRAQEKTESVTSGSTDDDWQDMAKKNVGGVDDWENALTEAGNADSQILIPVMPDEEGEEGEDPPEQQLLLF